MSKIKTFSVCLILLATCYSWTWAQPVAGATAKPATAQASAPAVKVTPALPDKATIGQITELNLELIVGKLRKELRELNKDKPSTSGPSQGPIAVAARAQLATPLVLPRVASDGSLPAPSLASDLGVTWISTVNGKHTAALRDGQRVAQGEKFTRRGVAFEVREITDRGVSLQRCEPGLKCSVVNLVVGS